MDMLNPDQLHRTTKLEIDDGRARSIDEAQEIMASYVLQIDVGSGIDESETRQAMLLTAVNTAVRAFLGGVHVCLRENVHLKVAWVAGVDMATAIENYGGKIVKSLNCNFPTFVIGDVKEQSVGSLVLHGTWEGWSGGVVEKTKDRLGESVEFPLAGMLAASLGVSEAFQHLRGDVVAGRRSTGLSLWDPRCDWRDTPASGEPCHYLPKRLWLIGLGHLGQAYAWALSLLPYRNRAAVDLVLQDFDSIVKANESTGMLSDDSLVGQKKARIVSTRLEALGFNTIINERHFDSATRRNINEPSVALAGVDDPAPRRHLETANFDLIVDAGLGGNPRNYLDIMIHSFPSGIEASRTFRPRGTQHTRPPVDQPAYQDFHRRAKTITDLTDDEIRCGIIDVAGRSVGAAFVGCVAATFVISEVLRFLAEAPRFEVFGVTLRNPEKIRVSPNTVKGPAINPGFVPARDVT
ncbi:MAG: hypothetical protein OXC91_08300 [Rhodobacteraceae bacterium]|nr:hypothetical protein [Paracoccaceae bacterium]